MPLVRSRRNSCAAWRTSSRWDEGPLGRFFARHFRGSAPGSKEVSVLRFGEFEILKITRHVKGPLSRPIAIALRMFKLLEQALELTSTVDACTIQWLTPPEVWTHGATLY